MFDVHEVHALAIERLNQAKEEVIAIYDTPQTAMMQTRVNTVFTTLITSLNALSGTERNAGTVIKQQFEPVTTFMGEPIDFAANKAFAADAEPTMDEVQLYQKKVSDLYLSIPAMDDNKVLADYHGNANMELVLRGVARKANVQNYEQAAINVEFIDAIKEGIKKNEADELLKEQEEAKFVNNLKEQDVQPQTIELTEQHLNAFPHLLEQGLKAGDTVDPAMLNVEPVKTPPAVATAPVQSKNADVKEDTTTNKAATKAPAAKDNKK